MSFAVGIRSGISQGVATGTRDGPSGGWYVPLTGNDFRALRLEPPTFLWHCQEASGDLSNAIGATLSLVANATGHAYAQTVTGWTRKFLGTDGSTSAQSWRTSSSLLNMAAGESWAMMCLASITAPAATSRPLMSMGGGTNMLAMSAPDGYLRHYANNVTTNGTVAQSPITTVRQFVWYRNATTDASGAVSNTDAVVGGTHYEGAVTSAVKGIGACSATINPVARIGWFAIWKGAAAEQNWSTYLATLRGA